MAPIRLITFDITNTIIRVAGSVGQQYAQIASTFNKSVDPTEINKAFGNVYKQQVKKYPNFGITSGFTTKKWWTEVVCKTFVEVGSDIPELELLQVSDKLYQYFCTQEAWEVLPEAEQTLQTLQTRGVKLGVISNFDERLEEILGNLNLEHYFDFILGSALEKVEKPDPEIFHRALRTSGISADESLHVGDNVMTDYFGAKNMGMQAGLIWKKDKNIPSNVDRNCILFSIHEIIKFL